MDDNIAVQGVDILTEPRDEGRLTTDPSSKELSRSAREKIPNNKYSLDWRTHHCSCVHGERCTSMVPDDVSLQHISIMGVVHQSS